MRLSSAERGRLKGAIALNVSSRDQLEETVKLAGQISLDWVAMGDGLDAIVDKVIAKAQDENWLGPLLEALHKQRPLDNDFKELLESYQAQAPLPGEDPYDACWLGCKRVMVDRVGLRSALRNMLEGWGSRILVVSGERYSGRSHSQFLISFLAQQHDFQVRGIDLERLARAAENGELRPEDLGQSIVDQLGLSGMRKRYNETDARWSGEFCDWLAGQIPSLTMEYWLVIDSFDKTFVPQAIYDLIDELALRISRGQIEKLRLVLLSYPSEASLPSEVVDGAEAEHIEQFGRNEVLELFTKLYEARKTRTQQGYAADDLAQSVKQVWQQVDQTQPAWRMTLARVLFEEAKARQLLKLGGQP